MQNLKDKLTNIVALVIVIGAAIKTFLDASTGQDINWLQLVFAVAVAVIGWLTGKNSDGKKVS
jgi:hypothetical protein